MEETISVFSRKNSSHAEKPKITAEQKINELHDLIQTYLYHCDQRKVQTILPVIEQAKLQLKSKRQQKERALSFKPSQQQLLLYHKTKNHFIQVIKDLGKKIEFSKNRLKEVKIQQKQIEKQVHKNQQLLRDLQAKCYQCGDRKKQVVLGKFPRISGFNYDLHHLNPKRSTNSVLSSLLYKSGRPSSGARSQEDKENFYNSLNFRRLKQIQKLLDQITIECHSFKFEKLLVGDKKQSIAKKVFKNFSITQFFDKFINQKNVLKLLMKIEKQ